MRNACSKQLIVDIQSERTRIRQVRKTMTQARKSPESSDISPSNTQSLPHEPSQEHRAGADVVCALQSVDGAPAVTADQSVVLPGGGMIPRSCIDYATQANYTPHLDDVV